MHCAIHDRFVDPSIYEQSSSQRNRTFFRTFAGRKFQLKYRATRVVFGGIVKKKTQQQSILRTTFPPPHLP
jgi:hypothetical protein